MVLPISLTSSEGLDVVVVVFWVTRMYGGVTRMWNQGVAQRRCDWYVLRMGCYFHASFQILGNLDVRYRGRIKIVRLDCLS